MTSVRLTVIGSINEDITAVGDRLPGPGETVTAADVQRTPGGMGANQAAAAARLGAEVRLIGATGNDAAGRRSIEALRLAGVDVSRVQVTDRPTGAALIVVDAGGQNQIAVAPGANHAISVTSADCAAPAVLCQLELTLETITSVAERASGFLALNASPALPLPPEVVDRCDLIVVNESEYAAMPALSTARLAVVTYGPRGAVMLRHGNHVVDVEAPKVEAVSSVGAGDAFCAALVLGLLDDLPALPLLEAACAVGAAAVTTAHTQPQLRPLRPYLPT